MFLSRETKDEDIDMGLCYSILHKCIRRCLVKEALYYGKLIYNDGTPNALKRRLIMYCIEDMCRLDLALEIFNAPNNKLIFYIQIVAKNKKTRISDWFRIVCNDYHKYSTVSESNELIDGIKMRRLEKNGRFQEIRKFLGNDLSKLYTFMNKESYVWIVKILWQYRDELKYKLDKTIDLKLKDNKFDEIPTYVMDKHVINGTPGLKFFFENGGIIFNKIYENEPYEFEAKNIALFNESIDNQDNKLEASDINIIKMEQLGYRDIEKVSKRSYYCSNFSDGKKYVLKKIETKKEKENFKFIKNIKKIIKLPRIKSKIILIDKKSWIKSELINGSIKNEFDCKSIEFKSSDFFGFNRNILYDPKNLLIIKFFKIIMNSKDADNYYLIDKKTKIVYGLDNTILKQKITNDLNKIFNDEVINYIKKNKDELVRILNKWNKKIESLDESWIQLNINILVDFINSIDS